MSKPEVKLRQALTNAGWTRVRRNSHEVWRCACGEHSTAIATTHGRGRGLANKVSELSSPTRFGSCAINKSGALG